MSVSWLPQTEPTRRFDQAGTGRSHAKGAAREPFAEQVQVVHRLRDRLDEHALRRSLGVFLILYSIYALATAKASRAVSGRWRGALAAGTGIAGGLLGTLFGAGVGPIYVVYFSALRMEKEIFRVTMSTVVLLGGAARIAGYASFGFYERSSIALIAIGLPLVVVGSWLGDRVIRRLNPQMFTWLVGGLIFLSGVALLVK
jgi:uncharacterized protein